VAVLALVPLAGRAAGGGIDDSGVLDRLLPAHPARLVVKYRPTVAACAHCLLARGASFASVTGRDSLDRLHRDLGVRAARALFFERHALVGAAASDAFHGRLARAASRFAARQGRARAPRAPDLSNVYVLTLKPGGDVARAAARYAADPDVVYAHPDYRVRASLTLDDPFLSSAGTWGQPYADLWGLLETGAPVAWDRSTGGGVVVGVIDSGIDMSHPDLAATLWANPGEIAGNGLDDDANGFVDDVRGWDFVDLDNDPADRHGHGTHVAGTIAAVGNNGIGVAGMAFDARVMAVRGLDRTGGGFVSGLAAGIVYAAENGADVLNNSWGGFGRSLALVDAVDTAGALGAVVVAAAGNESANVNAAEPAGIDGVIAVAATAPGDTYAGFSNRGDALAVAAPGVDVLSARAAAAGPQIGGAVPPSYLRLSGTSMACAHVSGLAALLLSARPDLGVDAVRWHIEANADQPGYPGYEGEPWNPLFGWGRIDAARVFDAPLVTTRPTPRAVEVHGFAGGTVADAAVAAVDFTSLEPVPWTLITPPWLRATATSGSGAATLGFSLDATTLTPRSVAGTVVFVAPTAADGGGRLFVDAHVHRDERVGPEIGLSPGTTRVTGPRAASNGLVTLVAWGRAAGTDPAPGIRAAVIDTAGDAIGPLVLADGGAEATSVDVASDGRNFLVVWIEPSPLFPGGIDTVYALRVAPSGEALDVAPLVIESARVRGGNNLFDVRAAFDGEAYTIVWGHRNHADGRDQIFVRRLGIEGTLGARRRRLPAGGGVRGRIEPTLACARRSCMVAWQETGLEITAAGKPIGNAHVLRLVGDRPVGGGPVEVLRDVDAVTAIVSDGRDYFVAGDRTNVCEGPVVCGRDVVGARVTGDAVPLDPDGVRLNRPGTDPGDPNALRSATGLAFDGTDYLATFVSRVPTRSAPGFNVFVARVGTDGVVVGDEAEGLLVHDAGTALGGAIAAEPTATLVAWADNRLTGSSGPFAIASSVFAQRVLERAPVAVPPAIVGLIGLRALAEGETLSFRLATQGLRPATTVFAAANLPPGAALEPSTGLFRWRPGPDEAGVYPSVVFEASDGVARVSEEVTFTVIESRLSISGRASFADGRPAAGLALELAGARPTRTGFTDADGRYRFDVASPRAYRLRLARPSSREYRAATLRVAVGAGDVRAADLVVVPR
jgi:subtilisin family serine protease